MIPIRISLYFLSFLLFFSSCSEQTDQKERIVYVNSYHQGHPSSDEIMRAIQESFPADSFELSIFLMDTKRNADLPFIQHLAKEISDSIIAADPDILIVSDDNAVKYVVQPLIKQHNLPVVFCGVNWSDQEYDLPSNQVTGMLEILPVADLLETMQSYYPSMKELLILTENTTTSRKEAQLLDTLFQRLDLIPTNRLVDNFSEWKEIFQEAQTAYDIIYIPTNGGIKGWDHEEAVNFVSQHIQVPLVTCEDFMMPYVVFGMTKVAKEQGLWAAETAKKILKGSSPSAYPVTRNQLSTTWLNTGLADKIGFQPDTTSMSRMEIVGLYSPTL